MPANMSEINTCASAGALHVSAIRLELTLKKKVLHTLGELGLRKRGLTYAWRTYS
jgi:hypothetical protein